MNNASLSKFFHSCPLPHLGPPTTTTTTLSLFFSTSIFMFTEKLQIHRLSPFLSNFLSSPLLKLCCHITLCSCRCYYTPTWQICCCNACRPPPPLQFCLDCPEKKSSKQRVNYRYYLPSHDGVLRTHFLQIFITLNCL